MNDLQHYLESARAGACLADALRTLLASGGADVAAVQAALDGYEAALHSHHRVSMGV